VVKQLDGMLAPVAAHFADLIGQPGLAGLSRASVAALLCRDVFVSGFATHFLHPPCIQGVIFCESTNPFRPRPIGLFGVMKIFLYRDEKREMIGNGK